MHLIPTILCGGAGSRLWPVSRELHPKPFIRLRDGESLLQKAFIRGASLPNSAEILTITNQGLLFKTQDEYQEVNKAKIPTTFILEPEGRNTAAALAAAVLYAADRYGPDAILLALAADHLITDQPAFADAVTRAVALAQSGKLAVFGIKPEHPETGFGYIEAKGEQVIRFVEKPTLEVARDYVQSGRFLWNAGMFCFTAQTMLAEMEQFCPDILAAMRVTVERSPVVAVGSGRKIDLDADAFAQVPENSIDYAVLEKSSNVAVVACSIGWSDIGSWNALGELTAADQDGNRVVGEAVLVDSHNCFIQSRGRLVGAVGVDDLIIVDTSDALLVANKSKAQDVKQIFAQLKELGHETQRLHRTVFRPWGSYTILEEGPSFKIKRIVVKPGGELSLQMHHHRSEHWVVVSGVAKVINGERELVVNTNESTFIPAGHRHRLRNPGVIDLVMIEVQSGEYLGEDDIVRFEDNYGRA